MHTCLPVKRNEQAGNGENRVMRGRSAAEVERIVPWYMGDAPLACEGTAVWCAGVIVRRGSSWAGDVRSWGGYGHGRMVWANRHRLVTSVMGNGLR